MARGKHTLKPRAMRRIRQGIGRGLIRAAEAEARRQRQNKKQRKEEDQKVLEARVNNERRREEQKARVDKAIRRLADSVR